MVKSKITTIPTDDEIQAGRADFMANVKEKIEAKKSGTGSPKMSFLSKISEDIKSLLNDGASYVQIKDAIKNIYSIDISTQIIADFAHTHLGIVKSKRKKIESAQDMKERIANEPEKDGELTL